MLTSVPTSLTEGPVYMAVGRSGSVCQSGVNQTFKNQQLELIQWKVNATRSGNKIEPLHYVLAKYSQANQMQTKSQYLDTFLNVYQITCKTYCRINIK